MTEATTTPNSILPSDSGLAWLVESGRELTAVEQFARTQESPLVRNEQRYRELLPATPPGPGQQYSFEVDLDRCSGCKACVTACNSLNGLDEGETWREVGLLHGGGQELPILQHVTAACHHCVEPACMHGCPVKAYEKDPITGIVRHLDDQCIGCQFCTLACPYGAPRYNKRLGIVRKCDMCSQRLAVGEAPACVQACPHTAIQIKLVDVEAIVANCTTRQLLPYAPPSVLTIPTTTYRSSKPLPSDLLPADYHAVRPEHAHWPLIVMLILTQLSVGAFAAHAALRHILPGDWAASAEPFHAMFALAVGLIALTASLCHLGRPRFAYRAVLGLRTSWLSREIVAFGAFAATASLYAMAALPTGPLPLVGRTLEALSMAVVLSGVGGVFCSVMIYGCTRREYWNVPTTLLRFFLTAWLLGLATLLAVLAWTALSGDRLLAQQTFALAGVPIAKCLALTAAGKMAFEAFIFRHLRDRRPTGLRRSAELMAHTLRAVTFARFVLGAVGGMLLPGLLLSAMGGETPSVAFTAIVCTASFLLCTGGEFLERYLFFTAVVPPRMPGSLTT